MSRPMSKRFGDDFNAFGLVPLVQNCGFKIASMVNYNDHVYVGTTNGRIVVFRDEPGASALIESKLGRSKPVDGLAIMGPLQRIIALCGGRVFVRDLYSLQPCKAEETAMNKRARGAGVFCADRAGPPLWRVAFGVKRKLVLFEHQTQGGGAGAAWTFLKELAMPESVAALCWHGDSICVGYKREYNIVKVNTGQIISVGLTLESPAEPYIKVLPGPQFLLGGMEQVGVIVDGNAMPTSGVVGWSGAVKASAYTFPYLTSLVASKPRHGDGDGDGGDGGLGGAAASRLKGIFGGGGGDGGGGGGGSGNGGGGNGKVIEVHSVIDQHKVVQTIQVPPDAVQLVDSSDHFDAAAASPARHTSKIFFASSTAVYQVNMLPFPSQISQLLHSVKIDAAQALMNATSGDRGDAAAQEAERSAFSVEAGVTLFSNLMFEDAIPYLCKSALDLRELLQLFPDLQPIDGLGVDFEPQIVKPRSRGGNLPNNVTDMPSLVHTMRSKHRRIRTRDSSDGGGASSKRSNIAKLGTDEEVLEQARACVLEVFEDRRRRTLAGEWGLEEEGGWPGPGLHLIDTCIFHLYATLKKKQDGGWRELEAFVSHENALRMPDVTGVLQRQGLFHVLALLNANKGQSREALEIWMRIGNGEYEDASGKGGVRETVKFLCNLGTGGPEGSAGGDGGGGSGSSAVAAEEESHLVWTFSSWVLRTSPADGIKIFTESTRPRQLPPDRVLEFLSSFVAARSGGGGGGGGAEGETGGDDALELVWPREARVAFLEYLIGREAGAEEHYHTQLALELVHMTVYALAHGVSSSSLASTGAVTDRPRHHRRPDSMEIGKRSDLAARLANPSRASVYGAIGGIGGPKKTVRQVRRPSSYGKYPPVRRKLLNLLRSSRKYNNSQLLTVTAGKGLHEERVLLLCHAGSHLDALRILVFDLRDLREAERYCAEHSPPEDQDPTHARGLFLPLINLYLERGDQRTAMELLRRHAPRIDPIQAMSQLPEVTTVATLQPFLQNMLRHSTHRRSQALISRSLAKTRNLNVRCELAVLETRAVVTTQSTVCCVCGYQIQPNTVFVVYPAGQIAHLKCSAGIGLDRHPLPPHEPLRAMNRDDAFNWRLLG